MRFELAAPRDPIAVRLALVACRAPFRVERDGTRRAIVVAASDAGLAAAFLRAGLVARPAPPWPEARAGRRGILLAGGASWCVGKVPVDAAPDGTAAVLVLAPVPRDDALRALATCLRAGGRGPFSRRPRPLALVAARIAGGEDGVVAARAYALATGSSDADALRALAATRATRLRAGALDAWREIASPRGGVWRSLAAFEAWWS